MDTRFIDTFVMVAECGSMAEAARRIHITPTALSQRLRTLERELGAPLVTRSGRFVRLTEAGARLLARARKFQRDVRELEMAVSEEGFPGGLRIGTIRTALTNVMPDLLRYIALRHPSLDATMEIGTSHDLYHQLVTGKVDAALLVEPPFKLPKAYVWHMLRTEPLVLLAPAHLAGQDPDAILAEQPMIRYDRRTWGGLLGEQYLQERGLHPQERFELDSPDGILLLVSMGLGVSLVPDCYPRAAVPDTAVILPLPEGRPVRQLGFLWPRQSQYARLFEAMVNSRPEGEGKTL
ncbi:LysR family transcriptional regulator [Cupriavidus pauculus]|uniref:LysR family transcriptional regulator n=1 Tax=Cupriavidus pauculus TaxID=82633 RepID=A0A5P2HA72_9BURK|nr:LysR family transcriptional regulator [Cupriavidus pauculus]QET04896.1 LysR family transcriptional regulator [Cupriavidus pauculus]